MKGTKEQLRGGRAGDGELRKPPENILLDGKYLLDVKGLTAPTLFVTFPLSRKS